MRACGAILAPLHHVSCANWTQVVQCLTELGLSIKRARISSDGGWFVDGEGTHGEQRGGGSCPAPCMIYHAAWPNSEFFVTETPKGKVVDPRKLALIKRVRGDG